VDIHNNISKLADAVRASAESYQSQMNGGVGYSSGGSGDVGSSSGSFTFDRTLQVKPVKGAVDEKTTVAQREAFIIHILTTKYGMTLEQASAWAGTARKESTNDPYSVNPSSKATGLYQQTSTGGRKEAMLAYAPMTGFIFDNMEKQIDFAMKESKEMQGFKNLDDFKQQRPLPEMVNHILNNFLRPSMRERAFPEYQTYSQEALTNAKARLNSPPATTTNATNPPKTPTQTGNANSDNNNTSKNQSNQTTKPQDGFTTNIPTPKWNTPQEAYKNTIVGKDNKNGSGLINVAKGLFTDAKDQQFYTGISEAIVKGVLQIQTLEGKIVDAKWDSERFMPLDEDSKKKILPIIDDPRWKYINDSAKEKGTLDTLIENIKNTQLYNNNPLEKYHNYKFPNNQSSLPSSNLVASNNLTGIIPNPSNQIVDKNTTWAELNKAMKNGISINNLPQDGIPINLPSKDQIAKLPVLNNNQNKKPVLILDAGHSEDKRQGTNGTTKGFSLNGKSLEAVALEILTPIIATQLNQLGVPTQVFESNKTNITKRSEEFIQLAKSLDALALQIHLDIPNGEDGVIVGGGGKRTPFTNALEDEFGLNKFDKTRSGLAIPRLGGTLLELAPMNKQVTDMFLRAINSGDYSEITKWAKKHALGIKEAVDSLDKTNKQSAINNQNQNRNNQSNWQPVSIQGTTKKEQGIRSTGSHTHIEVRDSQGDIVNPKEFAKYFRVDGKPLADYIETSGFRTKERPNHQGIDFDPGAGSVLSSNLKPLGYKYEPTSGGVTSFEAPGGYIVKLRHQADESQQLMNQAMGNFTGSINSFTLDMSKFPKINQIAFDNGSGVASNLANATSNQNNLYQAPANRNYMANAGDAVISYSDIQPLMDIIEQNKTLSSDDIKALLYEILSLKEAGNLKGIQEIMKQLGLKLQDLRQYKVNLEMANIEQKKITTRLENEVKIYDAVQANLDQTRQIQDTYRNLSLQIKDFVVNAKGYLTFAEETSRLYTELENKAYDFNKSSFDLEKTIDQLLGQTEDLSPDEREKKASENITKIKTSLDEGSLNISDEFTEKLKIVLDSALPNLEKVKAIKEISKLSREEVDLGTAITKNAYAVNRAYEYRIETMKGLAQYNRVIAEYENKKNPFKTDGLRKAAAVDELIRQKEEFKALEDMAKKFPEMAGVIGELIEKYAELNKSKLDDVIKETSLFYKAFNEPIKTAIGDTINSFTKGEKSFNDIAKSFLDSIANFFTEMTATMLQNEAMKLLSNLFEGTFIGEYLGLKNVNNVRQDVTGQSISSVASLAGLGFQSVENESYSLDGSTFGTSGSTYDFSKPVNPIASVGKDLSSGLTDYTADYVTGSVVNGKLTDSRINPDQGESFEGGSFVLGGRHPFEKLLGGDKSAAAQLQLANTTLQQILAALSTNQMNSPIGSEIGSSVTEIPFKSDYLSLNSANSINPYENGTGLSLSQGFDNSLFPLMISASETLNNGLTNSFGDINSMLGETHIGLQQGFMAFVSMLSGGSGGSGGGILGTILNTGLNMAVGAFTGGIGSAITGGNTGLGNFASPDAFTNIGAGATNFSFDAGTTLKGFKEGGQITTLDIPNFKEGGQITTLDIPNFKEGGEITQLPNIGNFMAGGVVTQLPNISNFIDGGAVTQLPNISNFMDGGAVTQLPNISNFMDGGAVTQLPNISNFMDGGAVTQLPNISNFMDGGAVTQLPNISNFMAGGAVTQLPNISNFNNGGAVTQLPNISNFNNGGAVTQLPNISNFIDGGAVTQLPNISNFMDGGAVTQLPNISNFMDGGAVTQLPNISNFNNGGAVTQLPNISNFMDGGAVTQLPNISNFMAGGAVTQLPNISNFNNGGAVTQLPNISNFIDGGAVTQLPNISNFNNGGAVTQLPNISNFNNGGAVTQLPNISNFNNGGAVTQLPNISNFNNGGAVTQLPNISNFMDGGAVTQLPNISNFIAGGAVTQLPNINNFMAGGAVTQLPNISNFIDGGAVTQLPNINNFMAGGAVTQLPNISNFMAGGAVAQLPNISNFIDGGAVTQLPNISNFIDGGAVTQLPNINNFMAGGAVTQLPNISNFMDGGAVTQLPNINNFMDGGAVTQLPNISNFMAGGAVTQLPNISNFMNGGEVTELPNISNFMDGGAVTELPNISNFMDGGEVTELPNINNFMAGGEVTQLPNISNFIAGGEVTQLPNINNFMDGGAVTQLPNISNFMNGGEVTQLPNISNFMNGGEVTQLPNISNFMDGGAVKPEIIPNFADGGTIGQKIPKVDNFLNGGKAKNKLESMVNLSLGISKAMKKEGANALPIVVSLNEQILSQKNGDADFFRYLEKSGEWESLKSDYKYNKNIPNYLNGGSIGNPTTNNMNRSNSNTVVNNNSYVTVKATDVNSFRKSSSLIAQEQRIAQSKANNYT
jgi:hypothetical protein